MSKKLKKAIAEGKVVVRNITSGEVQITYRGPDGNRSTLIVAPHSDRELAPRFTPPVMLLKGTNLDTLLRRSLRIVMS